MPYRYLYFGLGCVVVAAIILGVAFGRSGAPEPLPFPIESLRPARGDTVLRQAYVEVDLDSNYRADVFINGFLIPQPELTYIEATGVHRWRPGPRSVILTEWVPGEQTVRVVWDTIAGLPSPGEFTWSFRVQ
ncbi:MAG TPA: hypothetical protein VM470_05615 [Acidimicrobiia bacterium]|nr:hypothetical protein [Acidimicrobiia bacterium]